uniref:O-antigen ligase family protein n=1 Tax=Flavobacterium sp. TaxID=239 RepID=UPI004049A357
MKSEDKIYNNLYLLFFLSAPLVYSKDIIDPTLAPRQIHLAFFCCVLMVVLFVRKKDRINELKINFTTTLLPITLIVFLLTIIVSLIQATVISEGFFVLSRIALTFLFFSLTTLLLIGNKLSVTSILKGVLLFAALSSLIASFQILSYNELSEISATMANKNLLSSALFLCIPFLMISKFDLKSLNLARYFTLGLILIIIFYLQTRAVIIPLIIGGALLLIYTIFYQFKKGKTKTAVIALTTLTFLTLSFVVVIQDKNTITTFTNSNTLQTRVKLWDNTKSIIGDNLFFGIGAGNWKVEFANYGIGDLPPRAREGKMIYQRPHNDFLWFFSEFGVFGFIAYCGIFLISFYYLAKLFRYSQTSSEKLKYLILF